MGIIALNQEFEDLTNSLSQFPSFDTEVEDVKGAARLHERRIGLWRSSTLEKLSNLRVSLQEAENDPSGKALAEILGPLRAEIIGAFDQTADEVAARPFEMDVKLDFIMRIGDASARMAADNINKIFIRMQRKHLKYLSEIRSELESLFLSIDLDEKVDALARESIEQFPVVNAYLAQ